VPAKGGWQEKPSEEAAAAIPFPQTHFLAAAASYFKKSAAGGQNL